MDGMTQAILVGREGQNAIEKNLRSGRKVTMVSIGIGGMRNNRRPLQSEEPRDYANWSMVQWHRVSIYPERLGALVVKNTVHGTSFELYGATWFFCLNMAWTGLRTHGSDLAPGCLDPELLGERGLFEIEIWNPTSSKTHLEDVVC